MSIKNNIVKHFLNTLERNPDFSVLKYKHNNQWKNFSRMNLLNSIQNCTLTLYNNSVVKGDRIAYKGKNSIEWLAWNLAAQSLGAIWVPMYEQQDIKQCQFIINDCQPKLLITNQTPKIGNITIIRNTIESDKKYNSMPLFNIDHNDLSTLIYTSGTTGNPKGVKLTHDNILSNISGIRSRFHDIDSNLTSLNILPWAHIYGLTCELYYNLLYDNTTALCSDKLDFIKECKEIKPEVLFIVPKVLETVKTKVQFLDKPIIRCILPKIINRLFGNNLQNIFIGGAKLDENTRNFYENNNVLVCEGYGCSETSPMVSVNHLYHSRNTDSIGKILDNVIVEIINDEICVSGPNVMKGYWNAEEETKKALIEKDDKIFYKTGDSGYIKDGFLFFNGRISENYKMSNGKFVNVGIVESTIKKYISTHFIIYGENMDYNVLIVEEPFNEKILHKINNDIESYLKIKKVIYISSKEMEQFLTPKMSIKRKKLIEFVINSEKMNK